MTIQITVPTLGESITEATVAKWFKNVGDPVAADETLVELETDKVTLEVPAPGAGVISAIDVKDGATVGVGALLGSIEANGAAAAPKPAAEKAAPVAAVAEARPREAAQPAKAGGWDHHDVWILTITILVNLIATGLKLGDRTQVGALEREEDDEKGGDDAEDQRVRRLRVGVGLVGVEGDGDDDRRDGEDAEQAEQRGALEPA